MSYGDPRYGRQEGPGIGAGLMVRMIPILIGLVSVGVMMARGCQQGPFGRVQIVAAMKTHNITNILTFNGGDFARYPGMTVLDPNTIAASGNPPNR